MAKFEIWFDHTVVMATALTIDAKDEAEAREKAWEIVFRNLEGSIAPGDPDLDWWENDSKSIEMVNCEELEHAPQ